jgi:hypothetical protein
MPEREDLQFLAPVTTHQQERESEDMTEDEVEEGPEHNQPGWPLPHRARAINLQIRSTHPASAPHTLPEQVNVNLDRGYDSDKTRAALAEHGFTGEIARKGLPAPIQAGKRWVVERSHSWMNGFGKLRRCTEKRSRTVDFYLYLAAAIVTLRMLIRRATRIYRWDRRPTTRRLK